jgi:hypothetical protein
METHDGTMSFDEISSTTLSGVTLRTTTRTDVTAWNRMPMIVDNYQTAYEGNGYTSNGVMRASSAFISRRRFLEVVSSTSLSVMRNISMNSSG